MIGFAGIVLPALTAWVVMSLSTSSSLSTTTLAIAAAVLPTIMLGKLFRPVRYYLRLTSFLLGIGQFPQSLPPRPPASVGGEAPSIPPRGADRGVVPLFLWVRSGMLGLWHLLVDCDEFDWAEQGYQLHCG